MANQPIGQQRSLQVSVLDRLIDYEPEVSRDPYKTEAQQLREIKNAIRRDLQNLLNTRWRCLEAPADLTELQTSMVNYGVPDLSGQDLGSHAGQKKFCDLIEEVIRRYEPRFKRVSVGIRRGEQWENIERTLRFRIEAWLATEPAPEQIVFDTAVEPTTHEFEVK